MKHTKNVYNNLDLKIYLNKIRLNVKIGVNVEIIFPVHKWKKHRRLISPSFNSTLLSQFFPVFNEKNKILIKNLKKELGKTTPFDLWDYIAPTTLNLICREYFNI